MTTEKLQDKIIGKRKVKLGELEILDVSDVRQKLFDLKKEIKERMKYKIMFSNNQVFELLDEVFAKHIGDKLGGGE